MHERPILFTGATGYIGSRLLREIEAGGYAVWCLARQPAGDWFEIARFPSRFQRQCVGDVRATYASRPDGRVDVVNRVVR